MTQFADLFRLDGKTALVVGAGRGIGAICAQGLADFGATVICADIDPVGAAGTARVINAAGHTAKTATLDVTDGASVDAVLKDFGTPDILVHTAAINVRKAMLGYTEDEFDRVINLNLRGTFILCQRVGAAMKERGAGSIIAFSSIRALMIEPGQSVYAASKAGVVQLLRTLAAELGSAGVRVNTVAPGVVETALTEQIRRDPVWNKAYADKSMLGRWARPDELVGPVVFLASDASSYVTGSQLLVDGGWTAVDGRFQPSV